MACKGGCPSMFEASVKASLNTAQSFLLSFECMAESALYVQAGRFPRQRRNSGERKTVSRYSDSNHVTIEWVRWHPKILPTCRSKLWIPMLGPRSVVSSRHVANVLPRGFVADHAHSGSALQDKTMCIKCKMHKIEAPYYPPLWSTTAFLTLLACGWEARFFREFKRAKRVKHELWVL